MSANPKNIIVLLCLRKAITNRRLRKMWIDKMREHAKGSKHLESIASECALLLTKTMRRSPRGERVHKFRHIRKIDKAIKNMGHKGVPYHLLYPIQLKGIKVD